MISIQKESSQDVLKLTVTNKLSEEDLDRCESYLKKHISSFNHPHLLMILEDFGGYENASAFMKDLKLDSQYIGNFDRIAVIGDKAWEKWAVQFLDPITNEELKYFSFDEKDQALAWINDFVHEESKHY